MVVNRSFWEGRRVFLTGHTGFKGGWLALWLTDMGSEVYGFALPPPTEPNFFKACRIQSRMKGGTLADIRDARVLAEAVQLTRPEIVFHLAAQPLVRHSYTAPIETYATNVMGVVHLLEAVRHAPSVRAVVNVTTDKCYENNGEHRPYREGDALGGHDPYSSSKGCSELVTAAYRRSFFESTGGVQLASARAGNVIGGGDWAVDRLIPDVLRAMDKGSPLTIRSPEATRPWQHVLEPLSGYLLLAEKLYSGDGCFAEAWNFGPEESDARSVQWVAERLCRQVPNMILRRSDALQPHESKHLALDNSKAKAKLGWRPRWDIQTALDRTWEWHQAWMGRMDMTEISTAQIRAYEGTTI